MEADRTILFADVSNSTGITEAIGDAAAREYIGEVLAEMASITRTLGGAIVKTIGDEIMSAFDSPLDAIAAAVDMQRAMSARAPIEGIPSAIKVGVHGGLVIIEGGDMFGDVVNVASRVVSLAAADQVLTTARTIERVDGENVPHRSLGVHGVRGRDERLHIVEVLWRGETAQMTVMAPKVTPITQPELEVRLGDEVRVLESGSDKMSLGRGKDASLVVPSAAASRAHAEILSRDGLFYLEDHSTNGTYVRPEGARDIFVHRGQVLLQGSGLIRLGEAIAVKGPLDIEYRTRYGS
jgi:adenylate cyclase